MRANPRAEPFFLIITLLMIGLIFAGFGSAAVYLEDFSFPPSTMLMTHGLIMLAWYVLTATQITLIGQSRFALHKTFGGASVVLVLLMMVTGYMVVSEAVEAPGFSIAGFNPLQATIFPSADLLFFGIFYALALHNRGNGDAHKRLMIFAGALMLAPATARLGLVIGFEPLPAIVGLGIALAILIYDWRRRGRPHWASVLGTVATIIGMPLRFVFGQSEAWQSIAAALYT